jgi:succinate dehydrogenase hydrophobic anchor subunit
MRPFAIRLSGVLGALLLGGLVVMALQVPLSVDIRERGDPTWLIALKFAIAMIATSAVYVALAKVVKRRLKKDATEIQLTVAALALMALIFGFAVFSAWFAFGT